MTPVRLWYQGARPKTLGAAVSPVLVGTAAGSLDGPIDWPRARRGASWSRSRCRSASTTPTTTPTACAAPTRTGAGRCGSTATGLATPARGAQRGRDLAFAVAAVVGARALARREPVAVARRGRGDRAPRSPTPAGRSRTATSASARSWCSCSSASSRPSAARTCSTRTLPGVGVGGARSRSGSRRAAILLANNVRDVDTDRGHGQAHARGAHRRGAGPRASTSACIAGAMVAVVACGAFVPSALLAVLALPLAVAPVRAMLTASRSARARSRRWSERCASSSCSARCSRSGLWARLARGRCARTTR